MSLQSAPNEYSPAWFELFLPPGAAAAEQETRFLCHWLPSHAYRRVLDLCCGTGRHARALAELGYEVTAVDRSLPALRCATVAAPRVNYLQADMRSMPFEDSSFDAVLCLWQSYGCFDELTNRRLVQAMRNALVPHGRLVLDVYHRSFFARHGGCREIIKGSTPGDRATRNRLQVELEYPGRAGVDRFDWELFEPDELGQIGEEVGLFLLLACADFDETVPTSEAKPRIQLVFEARLR